MAANLTVVAINTRRTIRYSIMFIIFLIFLRIIFGITSALYTTFVPESLPEPTVDFGPLPSIDFPDTKLTTDLPYTVETATGELPVLPEQVRIYFIPKQSSNLFSLDTAKTKAANLGFSASSKEISPSIYEFKSNTSAILKMNIITGDFSISYNLAVDSSPIKAQPPGVEIATGIVQNTLSKASLLPDDLSGPVTHEFLQIEAQQLVPSVSLSEANFTKINLYRKLLGEDYPSVTAVPGEANVWFIVSGTNNRESQILAAEYHHFPIDEELSGTYPAINAEEALQKLISGEGFIANLGNNTENIIIRKVYLAYFDPVIPGTFLQPVVVFEGSGEFVAYVPAVTAEYYGTK